MHIYGAILIVFSNWFPYGHNGIRTLEKTFGGNFTHVVCVLATKTQTRSCQYSPTVNVNEEAELTDMDRVKCSHGRWTMPNRLSCHMKCLPLIILCPSLLPHTGVDCMLKTGTKPGPSYGHSFYLCPKPSKEQCKFLKEIKWADLCINLKLPQHTYTRL